MADGRCRLRRPARPTAHSVHRRPVPVCLCARTAAGQRRGRHGVPAPKPPTQSRRSLRHLGREHAAAGAPPPPRPVSAPGPSLGATPRPDRRRLKRHGRQHARCRCTHAAATCLCVRNAAGSNPTGRPRARVADAVSDACLHADGSVVSACSCVGTTDIADVANVLDNTTSVDKATDASDASHTTCRRRQYTARGAPVRRLASRGYTRARTILRVASSCGGAPETARCSASACPPCTAATSRR